MQEATIFRVHHVALRDRRCDIGSREVHFDAHGISEPLTRYEWDYLLPIQGFSPAVAPEGEALEPLPAPEPEPEPDPMSALCERWRGMDLGTRRAFAADEELSVEALRALHAHEAKHRNAKSVLAVLHDQIVLRTKHRNGEQVNGALLRAAFPMAKEV